MRVPTLAPMLASPARSERFTSGYWAFEPKLDGWRVIVTIDDDGVCVRTGNGRDIAQAVPKCEDLRDALDGRTAVLDGELVAGAGRPDDFYRIIGRVGAAGWNRGARLSRTSRGRCWGWRTGAGRSAGCRPAHWFRSSSRSSPSRG